MRRRRKGRQPIHFPPAFFPHRDAQATRADAHIAGRLFIFGPSEKAFLSGLSVETDLGVMRLNIRRWISAPSAKSCTSSASFVMKSAYRSASTATGLALKGRSSEEARHQDTRRSVAAPIHLIACLPRFIAITRRSISTRYAAAIPISAPILWLILSRSETEVKGQNRILSSAEMKGRCREYEEVHALARICRGAENADFHAKSGGINPTRACRETET